MLPATRQNAGRFRSGPPSGGVKSPAPTAVAVVIVVFAIVREESFSHGVAAAARLAAARPNRRQLAMRMSNRYTTGFGGRFSDSGSWAGGIVCRLGRVENRGRPGALRAVGRRLENDRLPHFGSTEGLGWFRNSRFRRRRRRVCTDMFAGWRGTVFRRRRRCRGGSAPRNRGATS